MHEFEIIGKCVDYGYSNDRPWISIEPFSIDKETRYAITVYLSGLKLEDYEEELNTNYNVVVKGWIKTFKEGDKVLLMADDIFIVR